MVLRRAQRRINILVRICKRWAELRSSPALREVQCGAASTPSGAVFDILCRAEDRDPLWYMAVRLASPDAGGASAAITKWLQARCDPDRVPRPDGRKFTAYSVRIAIASTMWAYRMDERWIQTWGYWRTQAQYLTYVRKYYGRHPFVAGLVAFGFDMQAGRPFDFVGSASRADGDDGGLRERGDNSTPARAGLPGGRLQLGGSGRGGAAAAGAASAHTRARAGGGQLALRFR